MRVAIRSLVMAFAFLVLLGAGSAYSEGEKEYWNGPGWYITCFWEFDEDIVAGPYSDEAVCNAVKWSDDEYCNYYCVYVDADNLEDYGHYY